ncbi:DNA repair protein XRCC2 isoform X2 [Piliocolobus tephrosceles]|uniref:DNA repair protein XRCC2 isoform X2 n=1 Tax=Piliocolobus tephrosceles TaxID=591936 RepID=UPI000C2B4256|nr:DNA repair protein XRCC2 isoform X2 [Piliocolobus tephrosceles]
MCSDFHRAESGTELLARLEGRSSLKEIEPNLFADEDSPVHVLLGANRTRLKQPLEGMQYSRKVIFLNFMAQKEQEKQKCFIT